MERIRNRTKIIISIGSLILIFFFVVSAVARQPQNLITPHYILENNYQEVKLLHVIDGDTITCDVNGDVKKIRLIGIDAPESVSTNTSKNCEEGELASQHLKELLSDTSTLWISKDKSETDVYGRLLRFVWLKKPTEQPTTDEIKTKMLNAVLLQYGYAQAVDYEPDTTLSILFHQLGNDAIANSLGVTYKWK